MDWDNVRGQKPRPPAPLPTLDLLENCWRMKSPSGRIIACGIYRTEAPGLEVRAGFSDDDRCGHSALRRLAAVASLPSRGVKRHWRKAPLRSRRDPSHTATARS